MTLLNKIFYADDTQRTWVSVLTSATIAGLLTVFSIFSLGEYGLAIFVFVPLFMGACSTIIYGYKKGVHLGIALRLGMFTVLIYALGLIFFALEGLICIIMAAPIGVAISCIGSLIGYAIVGKSPKKSITMLIILFLAVPSTAFLEKDREYQLIKATTSIEIDANIETVWKNVIEFPDLEAPTEFLFNAGISYPISAHIDSTNEGAIRYCNFSTGSFVEPITQCKAPTLLAFDVLECPEPMSELSFWDIDAPHLHDYFVSQKGEFKLVKLSESKTKLIGTTWYYHKIAPEFYWKVWSNYIVHKIHNRVLQHIKLHAEK